VLLRVYGRSDQLADVGSVLERQGSATHAAPAPGVRWGQALLAADIDGARADAVLAFLRSRGVPRRTSRSRASTTWHRWPPAIRRRR